MQILTMFVSHADICADVSYGMYATRHGLNEEQLEHLWTNLGIFVSSCLQCGKVLIHLVIGNCNWRTWKVFRWTDCVPLLQHDERAREQSCQIELPSQCNTYCSHECIVQLMNIGKKKHHKAPTPCRARYFQA